MEADYFRMKLKKLREDAGLLQSELGQKAGLGQNTISQLETGDRKPSWATIVALCKALGVSCETFRPPPGGRPKKSPAE